MVCVNIFFNRRKNASKKVDNLLNDIDESINRLASRYSGSFELIYFDQFMDHPEGKWLPLNNTNAEIKITNKCPGIIDFETRISSGDLDFHAHPDALETLTLVAGDGRLIILDESKRKVHDANMKIDEAVEVKPHYYHKFEVKCGATTRGRLIKIDKNVREAESINKKL